MTFLSNRVLAVVVVFSIILSIASTMMLMNRITSIPGAPALSAKVSASGKINLTVQNSISIVLLTNVVDFGAGYVNVSCTEIATNGKNFSNMTTAGTIGGYADITDCWTGTTSPTGFVVENNGNVNVSVAVRGPELLSFFTDTDLDAYAGPYHYNLSIKAAENETGSCDGGTLVTTWRQLSSNSTMCSRLKYYPDSEDELRVDVNLLVPLDLGSGTYENSSIEFYATQV